MPENQENQQYRIEEKEGVSLNRAEIYVVNEINKKLLEEVDNDLAIYEKEYNYFISSCDQDYRLLTQKVSLQKINNQEEQSKFEMDMAKQQLELERVRDFEGSPLPDAIIALGVYDNNQGFMEEISNKDKKRSIDKLEKVCDIIGFDFKREGNKISVELKKDTKESKWIYIGGVYADNVKNKETLSSYDKNLFISRIIAGTVGLDNIDPKSVKTNFTPQVDLSNDELIKNDEIAKVTYRFDGFSFDLSENYTDR